MSGFNSWLQISQLLNSHSPSMIIFCKAREIWKPMCSDLTSKKCGSSTKIELKTWKMEYYKVLPFQCPRNHLFFFSSYFLKYLNIKPFNAPHLSKLIFTSNFGLCIERKMQSSSVKKQHLYNSLSYLNQKYHDFLTISHTPHHSQYPILWDP